MQVAGTIVFGCPVAFRKAVITERDLDSRQAVH